MLFRSVGVRDVLRPCAVLLGVIAAVVLFGACCSLWFDASGLAAAVACTLVSLGVYAAAMAPFVAGGALRPYAVTALSMITLQHPKGRPAAA